VGRKVPQQVELDPPRSFREHAGGIARLGRQVETADIDLEDGASANARAVQHELLPADRRLVGKLDPSDFGGERRSGEEGREHRDQWLAHLFILLMTTGTPRPRQRKSGHPRHGRPDSPMMVWGRLATSSVAYLHR